VLLEKLKAIRKKLATANGVPPYIIFGDNTLKEMSRSLPVNVPQLLAISGIGEIKAQKYGEEFLQYIQNYIQENNIAKSEVFPEPVKVESSRAKVDIKEKSYIVTVNMLKKCASLKEVAKQRELALTTIFSHINEYVSENGTLDVELNYSEFFDEEMEQMILKAIQSCGYQKLKPIKDELPHHIGYDAIRAVIAKNFLVKA
jgi:ATP-dependent DNA helicase RecQ